MSSVNERAAGREGASLLAPGLGVWAPRVQRGVPVAPGEVLGQLWRDGRALTVVVPSGAAGAAARIAAPGFVAFGELLVELGEVEGASLEAAAEAISGGPEGAVPLKAEVDGTVYLAPEPGAPAFAAPGTSVAAKATVALIEVMKTFTPLQSPVAGTVAQVDVVDGASVEAGAVLVWIQPAG